MLFDKIMRISPLEGPIYRVLVTGDFHEDAMNWSLQISVPICSRASSRPFGLWIAAEGMANSSWSSTLIGRAKEAMKQSLPYLIVLWQHGLLEQRT